MAEATRVAAGTRPQHPLEPLTAEEITVAVDLLRGQGQVGEHHRFVSVTLREPDKAVVARFAPGDTVDREAVAVVFDVSTAAAHEAIVAVTAGEVRAFEQVADGQPTILLEEMITAGELVKADPRWQDGVRRRGIEDLDTVQLDPWPAGNFGVERGHYDVSAAVAETALLPAVRAAGDAVVLADGFSCRTQLDQLAGVTGTHLAQLLASRLEQPPT